ncbi:MAG: glucosylceramidase [Clostridia bacterium]|nr:glucosylceramidase [Clostridia bacterium]
MEISRYETNYKNKMFFSKTRIKEKDIPKRFESKLINIYPEVEYQELLGFGGAITEASGYAYSKLDSEKKEKFIQDYFSEDGLNYALARLPIGSCDFSIKSYSYSNKPDLSDFSINKDKEYIFPLLNDANNKKELTIFSAPWSPPKFMKNSKMLILGGKLLPKYKQTLADYFVKYIKAYQDEGFNIKYVTVQNEPNAIQTWESCLYDAEEEADFVVNYLYPTLRNNNLNTKILIWDHNKESLFTRALSELSIEGANEKIAGLAFHYYSGNHFENIRLVREHFPNKLLIHTEGCTGQSDPNSQEEFKNGEIYAHDIIGDLNAGANGYIDWNILLDSKGGPNHKKNYCNSPIILDKSETDYIKTSAYYYIGHLSKFIKPNAKRIAFSKYNENLELTAFKNIDNSIILVILNNKWFNIDYNIHIKDKLIKDTINANSILTYKIKL